MRQDKRFHPGESISSKIIARLITPFFSRLITVDPHLHRYKSLNAIYKLKTKVLTANMLLADHIKKHYKNPVIIGPDEESYQWAETIASKINAAVLVCKKTRYSSRKVRIRFDKNIEFKNKIAIVVDDIISTGHTMVEAVKYIKKQRPKKIVCMAVHGLFVEGAFNRLKKAGADEIITTNSINHRTNKINLTKLISSNI